MNKIVIETLSHEFVHRGNPLPVIDNFSLTATEQETVAILGPSGCGKSTILRCIAGFIQPNKGNIVVNGLPAIIAAKEKKIGFAFQEPALLEWATVLENILLPSRLGIRTISTSQAESKAFQLMSLMGLKGFDSFYPLQLSGGMKQRVALARAMLLEPSLLLLDEPFGSLDLLTRTRLIVEFSKILKEARIPVILVTHSIEEAVFLADKVLVLSPRPCSIIKEIRPNLTELKDLHLFEKRGFLDAVAECRKILLEHWNNDENDKKS